MEDMAIMAIQCGMTHDQYWYGEPEIFTEYLNAYLSREKERYIESDAHNWMLGQYVMSAFANVIGQAFGGSKDITYPDEPIFSDSMLDEKYRKEREERKRVKALEAQHAKFLAMASGIRSK